MQKNRVILIYSLILLAFSGLVIRLFYLQIYDGTNLSKAASIQRMASSEIDKKRGEILDREGIPFTDRNKKVTLVLKPYLLRGKEPEIEEIGKILDVDGLKLKKEIELKSEPIIFEIDEEKKNLILDLKLQGVSVIYSMVRYGNNSIAKHVTGYLNKTDYTGQTGIEKAFENVLDNKNTSSVGVVTDAKSNVLPGLGYRLSKSNSGEEKLNVKLTLDYHIQKISETVMEKNNVTGALVVEDVCSGDVLAMVSKPDFNPNDIEGYLKSRKKELFNRAVASYNLGSVFKIIDLAQYFEVKGNTHPEEYFCQGYIFIGDKQYKCSSFEKGGHGQIGLKDAFALSCNPYFINMGIKLGYKNLINMAVKFGLGSNTGIGVQGIDEASGNLPSIKSSYSDGDTANIAIGQGDIMATPLQVADITATVANGGIRNRINIVDAIVDNDGNKIRNVRVKEGERIISKETSDSIKKLMEEVTETGTGIKANLDQYGGAGGKTGSAETGEFENGEKIVHAWFAGYFPKRNPKYSIAVFVENGMSGGQVAAPIFAEVAEEIMKKGY